MLKEKQLKLLEKFQSKAEKVFENMGACYEYYPRVDHQVYVIRWKVKFSYMPDSDYDLIVGFACTGVGKEEYENFIIDNYLKELEKIRLEVLERYFTIMTSKIGFKTDIKCVRYKK